MTILAPGCSKEQQTRRWAVHLFHLARVYRAKAVESLRFSADDDTTIVPFFVRIDELSQVSAVLVRAI